LEKNSSGFFDCGVRVVHQNHEDEKNSSGFFDCGVRVVHQNHEDEKNSSEFFEANAEAPMSVINWYF